MLSRRMDPLGEPWKKTNGSLMGQSAALETLVGHPHDMAHVVEVCGHLLKHSLGPQNILVLEQQEIWRGMDRDCRKHHEA